jgi:hypothetical protein
MAVIAALAGSWRPVRAVSNPAQHRTAGPGRTVNTQVGLGVQVGSYETRGRSLADLLIEIAYRYRIPMGIEYLDTSAVNKPLHASYKRVSVGRLIASLTALVPGYRASFAPGVVEIYSPRARRVSSSLMNAVIPRFEVTDSDPSVASAKLFAALARQRDPSVSVVNNIAVGTVGPASVTIRMKDARVYQVLNSIVASTRGGAIWLIKVPPDQLSRLQPDRWYVYGLDPAFEPTALSAVQRAAGGARPSR